jgi:hypothetical protein
MRKVCPYLHTASEAHCTATAASTGLRWEIKSSNYQIDTPSIETLARVPTVLFALARFPTLLPQKEKLKKN